MSTLEWIRDDCEMMSVSVKGKNGQKTLKIIAIYRSPKEGMHAVEVLADACSESREGHTIIAGDLNLPGIHWAGDAVAVGGGKAQEFASRLVNEEGFVQVVEKPTRGANILDVMLVRPGGLAGEVIVSPGISDHSAVCVQLNWAKAQFKEPDKEKIIWQFGRGDREGFQLFLRERFSEWISKGQSVEEIWETFKQIMNEGLSTFVPYKIIKENTDPEYYNHTIRSLKRKIRGIHKKRDRSPELSTKYKMLIRLLNKEKKLAKETFLRNLYYIQPDV